MRSGSLLGLGCRLGPRLPLRLGLLLPLGLLLGLGLLVGLLLGLGLALPDSGSRSRPVAQTPSVARGSVLVGPGPKGFR